MSARTSAYRRRSAFAAVTVLLICGGCSETTGFLSLELADIFWQDKLICSNDLRNIATLKAELTCGDLQFSETFSLPDPSTTGAASTFGAGSRLQPFVIKELPLDVTCSLTINGLNKYDRLIIQSNTNQKIEVKPGSEDHDPITLTEVSCNEAAGDKNCPVSYQDTDRDDIPDNEEAEIGTDPEKKDTDGDQVFDNNELQRCCSDPNNAEDICDEQLIQDITPTYAVPGSQVHLKMARGVDAVSIGQLRIEPGTPTRLSEQVVDLLTEPVADGTWIYGNLNPAAALGTVRYLPAGEDNADPYKDSLFAPLTGPATLVFDLDKRAAQKAPGQVEQKGLMRNAVDIVGTTDGLFVFGYVGVADNKAKPSLLFWQRGKAKPEDQVICRHELRPSQIVDPITPIALKVAGNSVVVLLKWVEASGKTHSGLMRLKLVQEPGGCHFEQNSTLWTFPELVAVGLELEAPQGQTTNVSNLVVQVLFSTSIYRVRLANNTTAETLAASKVASQIPLTTNDAKYVVRCSGFAYGGKVSDTIFVNCNEYCQGDPKCRPNTVKRIQGISSCMDTAKTIANCAKPTIAGYDSPLLGNPLVDDQTNRLFIRSSRGIVSTALDATKAFELKLYSVFSGSAPTNRTSGILVKHPDAGELFATNGAELRRITIPPNGAGPEGSNPVPSAPFTVAQTGEILYLSVSADGTLLDVVSSRDGSLLTDIVSVRLK